MGTDLPLPVFLAGRCQPRARARPRVRRTSRASAFSGLDTTLSRGADTLYSAGLPRPMHARGCRQGGVPSGTPCRSTTSTPQSFTSCVRTAARKRTSRSSRTSRAVSSWIAKSAANPGRWTCRATRTIATSRSRAAAAAGDHSRVDAPELPHAAVRRIDELHRVETKPFDELGTPRVRLVRDFDHGRSERQTRAGGQVGRAEIQIDEELVTRQRPAA